MPAVTPVLSQVVNFSAAPDARSAASDAAEQPFGNVLARQMNRQESSAPAETEGGEAGAATQSEDSVQDRQAAASPWLAMLQQIPAQQIVSPPEVPDGEDVAGDVLDQSGDPQGWWLQLAQGGALPATQPGLAGEADAPQKTGALQQAAMVSAQAGKDLPSAEMTGVAREALAGQALPSGTGGGFVDELAGQLESLDAAKSQQPVPSAMLQPQRVELAQAERPETVAQHVVREPVGDARWGDAVAQRVSLMLGRQEQQIDMQLNPPHLGPMEVRLTLGSDQASVVFASQHAAVREALAAATPRLSALLADQGIQLANVQVASDSLQQHAQQQANQQAASGGRQDGRYQVFRDAAAPAAESHLVGELSIPVARSGVSFYV